ncbi:TIGR03643 family protein [Luteolibacter sp. AS25]|uniref:TIGR03643 family protein n=1 Tax=Luteolibacter sp. AS25 TaxID=3135776 RepID=UPI00398AC59E
MNDQQRNQIIRMAWEDRSTFDEIKEKTGLAESDVIKLMRNEMKPSSFRMWRKRVTGRVTKHRKIFEETQAEIRKGKVCLEELE